MGPENCELASRDICSPLNETTNELLGSVRIMAPNMETNAHTWHRSPTQRRMSLLVGEVVLRGLQVPCFEVLPNTREKDCFTV